MIEKRRIRKRMTRMTGCLPPITLALALISPEFVVSAPAAAPGIPAEAHIESCITTTAERMAPGVIDPGGDACPNVIDFLRHACIVDARRWSNEYSHVAMRDRHGHLRLRGGQELRWMLRPGGLGYIESEQGERSFLVHCGR